MSGPWITATASDRRWRMPRGRLSGKDVDYVTHNPKRSIISCTRAEIRSAGR